MGEGVEYHDGERLIVVVAASFTLVCPTCPTTSHARISACSFIFRGMSCFQHCLKHCIKVFHSAR
jgi:hypothetical protein